MQQLSTYESGPYGVRVGLRAAPAGFRCNATICYATSPEGHTTIKEAQYQLNRIAAATGGKKLVVDGFVGADTLRLANEVFPTGWTNNQDLTTDIIAGDLGTTIRSEANGVTGKHEGVLASIQRQAVWAVQPVVAMTSTGKTTVLPSNIKSLPADVQPASAAAAVTKRIPTAKWVAFGLGAVFIVGLGVVVATRG